MDTMAAWNNMNADTKQLVIELYQQYLRTGSRSALEEIRRIFKNHGGSDPSERELGQILR